MTRIDFRCREDQRQLQFLHSSPTISTHARPMGDRPWLRLGFGRENLAPSIREAAPSFFCERGIQWWRLEHGDDPADTGGPTRHALSSQVACVNLLFPLRDDPDAIAALLRSVDADVVAAEPIRYSQGGRSFESFVELEWTGSPTLEGNGRRGAFATSADALLIARTVDGARRAYLIEWKYVEHYPIGRFLGAGRKGDVRRGRYLPLFDRVFRGGAGAFEAMLFDPFYQLMRLSLLADRMVRDRELGVDDARVLLVRPTDNGALRRRITSPALAAQSLRASTIEWAFRETLRRPESFRWTSPRSIVRAIRGRDEWAAYARERYRC